MAAGVIIQQGTAQEHGAVSGRCGGAELAGMYNRHGHRSPAHQQWCALLSLSGEHAVLVTACKLAVYSVTNSQPARQNGPLDNMSCAIIVDSSELACGHRLQLCFFAQTALYADLNAYGWKEKVHVALCRSTSQKH